MFKKEVKGVTYPHTVDSSHGITKEIPRDTSTTPNSSITEAVNEAGNAGRLKVAYNVGKRPETKSVQSTR